MYMFPYRCKVTGTPGKAAVAPGIPATWCEDNPSNCTKGPRQMIYWNQLERNNIVISGRDLAGDPKSPAYNSKLGFTNGLYYHLLSQTLTRMRRNIYWISYDRSPKGHIQERGAKCSPGFLAYLVAFHGYQLFCFSLSGHFRVLGHFSLICIDNVILIFSRSLLLHIYIYIYRYGFDTHVSSYWRLTLPSIGDMRSPHSRAGVLNAIYTVTCLKEWMAWNMEHRTPPKS
jgi:hypothetical protein